MTKKIIKLDKAVETFINIVSFIKDNGLVCNYDGTFKNYCKDGDVKLKITLGPADAFTHYTLHCICNGVKCDVCYFGENMYVAYIKSNNSSLVENVTYFQLKSINAEVRVDGGIYNCDFSFRAIRTKKSKKNKK